MKNRFQSTRTESEYSTNSSEQSDSENDDDESTEESHSEKQEESLYCSECGKPHHLNVQPQKRSVKRIIVSEDEDEE